MYLTRHLIDGQSRWARDDELLSSGIELAALLTLPIQNFNDVVSSLPADGPAGSDTVTPVEPAMEVWGSGVTYLRSRVAREAESTTADVYQKVYDAERPEIFFKSMGRRTVGTGQKVRIRADTTWNVPEPELTLVINAYGEIVGYAVGNDMSSRDIEGENPLYLPQAKTYRGACAVGPGILLCNADDMTDLTIQLEIERDGKQVFLDDTSTAQMKRTFPELVEYLYRELDFPNGAFLMTGTGIVPPDDFTLQVDDVIRISIGGHSLVNRVAQ